MYNIDKIKIKKKQRKRRKKMEIRDFTNEKLVEVIEGQDCWDTEEMEELLRRADINPASAPYVVDGECMMQLDDIYDEALAKLHIYC